MATKPLTEAQKKAIAADVINRHMVRYDEKLNGLYFALNAGLESRKGYLYSHEQVCLSISDLTNALKNIGFQPSQMRSDTHEKATHNHEPQVDFKTALQDKPEGQYITCAKDNTFGSLIFIPNTGDNFQKLADAGVTFPGHKAFANNRTPQRASAAR